MSDDQPLIQPFCAVRAAPEHAAEVIARPYDVISFAEAKTGAVGKPLSFLHVSRAEIDLPDTVDPHDRSVYERAAENFKALIKSGALIDDPEPAYYAYRMFQGDHVQTGFAAAASIAAYVANRVRRHEHTRPDKEHDRMMQIDAVDAHTGPVLVAYPDNAEVAAVLEAVTRTPPVADASTDEGTRHQIWKIADAEAVRRLSDAFEAMPAIYIADGHHRSAAAAGVARERAARAGRSADPVAGRFLIISFPQSQMQVLDYNRVVADLAGMDAPAFLQRLSADFRVTPATEAVRPDRRGVFGLFLGESWYRLEVANVAMLADNDPVARLDVSILSRLVLEKHLGIMDPRRDPRIDFVGGGRGLKELERRVRDGAAAAFSLYPTALADVMSVADAGLVMPPKSTWFEPKLADGLLSLPVSHI